MEINAAVGLIDKLKMDKDNKLRISNKNKVKCKDMVDK